MPSTLYASVKQSVAEFAEIKRKNEGDEERLLFRWKLLTIVLAIVFVIMIGLFSQFLKQYNERPEVQGDSSFVLPLLTQVSP